jgi:hypothetical protein
LSELSSVFTQFLKIFGRFEPGIFSIILFLEVLEFSSISIITFHFEDSPAGIMKIIQNQKVSRGSLSGRKTLRENRPGGEL